ncbi:hypothetical protein SAMN02745181_0555 [Rubritalea squalenifaciens DSM 18772]|uniref:Uncharacterized protein n=2 Tax=Rubritalea TaxID=361050 RepID=A0A1M6CSM3_9BACT|nr:hypothetical protein [Rubritalea squalenifaciens]SHI63970.1 hypothetical protein SAMN02745181_0555 [Rubritalea squalenifaciens DSM 18772]
MSTAEQFIETPLGKILIRAGAPAGACVSIQLLEPEKDFPGIESMEQVTAALLHIKTSMDIRNYFYECIWIDEPPAEGYGFGQHIETWQQDGYCLTMSTEDGETLNSRLPYAGFDNLATAIRHTERGLVIKVPHLPARTDTSLHFITAWNQKHIAGECPPSPASHIPHLALLDKELVHGPELPC